MAKTTKVKIGDLTQDPDNARRRDDKARGAIKASLERFGAGRSVVIDGEGTIRAGNGTVTEAAKLGIETVIVVEPAPGELVAVKRADWTEEEARAYGVADNKSTDLSRFDDGALAKILKSVPGVPPEAMGFDRKELVSFLAKVGGEGKKPPAPPRVIVTEAELADRLTLRQGDCLEVLRGLDDGIADAMVTDPPAGIAFMGKAWDRDKGGREKWIAWLGEVFAEARRVLKPGAHALVWSIPRTSHWTATALELAGFEIRDCVSHLFGTGFPKSLDVGKAIDDAAGAERLIVAPVNSDQFPSGIVNAGRGAGARTLIDREITAPATDAAKQWDGWGTGLKPAAELWWLVRVPLDGTIAANVEKHGTGAINIDGCRLGDSGGTKDLATGKGDKPNEVFGTYGACVTVDAGVGRWPGNVTLSHSPTCGEQCADDCPVAELDRQSGESKSTGGQASLGAFREGAIYGKGRDETEKRDPGFGDSGGASRFFYCAKPSTAERDDGLDHREAQTGGEATDRKDGSSGLSSPRAGAGRTGGRRNPHPTVKPIELMRWLCRLVTPPGGLVLDPFMGSGTTGIAALVEGAKFLGIEREQEYFEIARERILAGAARELDGKNSE
jgi:site-specific DNA-methyltransferase (adenine-specific)